MQSFVNLDDDDTKSESPDLGRSLYNVPPSHAGTPAAATELSNTEAPDHDVPPTAYTEPLYTKSTDQTVRASVAASAVPDVGIGVPLSNETSNPTQPARLRTPQPPTIVKDFAEGLSKSKRNLRNSLPRNPPESTSKSRKEPFDMYDPIETDTENSQKQQDRTSSGWAKLGSKEGTQLSPLNDVRKFLTNDDMRPPSLGTDELQSVAIRIHDSEQHHHPLSKILQRNHKNTNLQASATKVHTLMEPPKATSLGVSRKRQESSPKPLSRSVKASEELRDERACQEPPAGVVFDEAIQVKPPITLEKEIQLPEEQLSEKSMRRTQRPKEEAPQKRLERKRKSEELKSPSNTKAELERVAATAEEQKMVLQAKEAGDRERQSEADGDQGKEKDRAEQQKGKKIQEKERNGLSEAKDAKKQEQIEETKAKESKLKEQKNKVLEKKKDSKRLKTEQTTEPNVRQDAGKQPGERTMRTRTPGRKDSQAVKDLRAEMALQEALESCEHGRPKSPTPLSSSGSQETKTKSLTAFYPVTRGSRSSSLSIEHPKPPQETPSRGTKAGERPPLTSALRKSPNSLRRSASSISWANPVAPPDFLKPTKPTATAPRPSGDKLTGSSLITSGGVAVSHTRQPSVEITRTISASPIDTVQKKSRDPPKKTSTNIKKQTKLNVKRDVKLKGRVIDPPSPPKPVVEEALVISSDSNDTVSPFYSDSDDDVQEIRDPKAGPSSKKVKSDIKLATAKVVITPKTQPDSQVRAAQQATVELATPTIERPISSQQAKAVTTAKKLSDSQGAVTQQTPVKHAIPTAEGATSSQQSIVTNTQPKASSRSPARYVSSTPSSTSSASAKSDASAVSSSPPDIAPEPSSKAPLEMKSTPMDNRRGSSVSVKAKDVKATPAVDRRLSSQSSGTRSTQQTQNSDAMSVESAVDQQLQREARQFSEPAQIQVKSSPPTTQSQASKSNSQIRAKPVSTPSEYPYTMSGPRPANFRYPSLTNLRKNPPKYDPKEHLKHASFMLSSQRRDDHKPITSSQPNGVTREDESSSESEDESGSSSDNENDKVMSVRNPFSSSVGSQVSKKSDGRNAKGLSSLVKRMFFR